MKVKIKSPKKYYRKHDKIFWKKGIVTTINSVIIEVQETLAEIEAQETS